MEKVACDFSNPQDALLELLRTQLEFYMDDSNLSRDRFL